MATPAVTSSQFMEGNAYAPPHDVSRDSKELFPKAVPNVSAEHSDCGGDERSATVAP